MSALSVVIALYGLFAFFFGVWVGTRKERDAWLLRADLSTPHHADGRFFFIVSEGRYVNR